MANRAEGRILALSTLCLLVAACNSESESDADAAGFVIRNAKIYTVSESNPWAQAAAIRAGRFVYVGADDGVQPFDGPKTSSFDLGGKLVLPGLFDSHTHPGSIAIKGNEDLSKNLPALVPEHHELVERLERVVNHLSRTGVTSLLDAGNMGVEDQVYAAVAELDRSGRLPLRYEGTYHIRLPDQVPVAIEELKRLRARYAGDRLRFNTVKIHLDGINELRTAAVLEPYADDPGNLGGTTISGEVLQQLILDLNEESIDLHLHTNSDRAARIALDAVEAARQRAGGSLRTRVALCHLELLQEDDFPRFRELGVIANFALHWNGIGYLSSWGPSIGPERTAQRFRIRPLIEDGAIVTYSSDETTIAGLSRVSPFFSMQIGHNRQEVGVDPDSEIVAPIEERLELADIVEGYAKAGAYQFRAENDLGTIEVGKIADLIVLNQNFFEVDRNEIHRTAPTAVMLAGELVQGSFP